MSAQGDITSKMSKLDELYAALEKKGIDLKGNSSSSTTNAISGVTEQEEFPFKSMPKNYRKLILYPIPLRRR